MGCYLPSKGRDFQAIHNWPVVSSRLSIVVTYLVKVEIFKQFTTGVRDCTEVSWLLLT